MRRLAADGMDDVEIAWRFRRSPRYVRQVRQLSERPGRVARPNGDRLRPIERRILALREDGHDYIDLAPRFRHGVDYLRQVEDLARYKLRQG
jgi:hypothetical protein